MCDYSHIVEQLKGLIDHVNVKMSRETRKKAPSKPSLEESNLISAVDAICVKPYASKDEFLANWTKINDAGLTNIFNDQNISNIARLTTFWNLLKVLLCNREGVVKFTRLKQVLGILGFNVGLISLPLKVAYSILSVFCMPDLKNILTFVEFFQSIQDVNKEKDKEKEKEKEGKSKKIAPVRPITVKKVGKSIGSFVFDKVAVMTSACDLKTSLACAAAITSLTTLRFTGLPRFRWFDVGRIPVAAKGASAVTLPKDKSIELKKELWKQVMDQFADETREEKMRRVSKMYHACKFEQLAKNNQKTWASILNNDVISTGNNITVKASPGVFCLTTAFFSYLYKDDIAQTLGLGITNNVVGGYKKKLKQKQKQQGGVPKITDFTLALSPSAVDDDATIPDAVFLAIDTFYSEIVEKTLLLMEAISGTDA